MTAGETPPIWLSIVIAVYNSEDVVGSMIDQTLQFFDQLDKPAELVLVNDASEDGSWAVLQDRSRKDRRIVAVDLALNAGQHRALMIGLRHARGEYAATLDDDLQNPPGEVAHLLREAESGHDLVFGRFRIKRHGPLRIRGSKVVTRLNRLLYGLPRDLVVSNVRLLHRSVIDQVLALEGRLVYLTGLSVWCAESPANVSIEHRERAFGTGSYTVRRLLYLTVTIVLAHPRFPWRLLSTMGISGTVASVVCAALSMSWSTCAVVFLLSAAVWWLTRRGNTLQTEPLARVCEPRRA